MDQFRPVQTEGMPRFIGGAVGFLGFEYTHAVEPTVPLVSDDPTGMPVIHFMITDTVVIFDRANQTLRLLINAHTSDDPSAAYDDAVTALEQLYHALQDERSIAPTPVSADPGTIEVPAGNMDPEAFKDLVRRSKQYIRDGDVIQVVLSQRFERPFKQTPLDLYRALRTVNPSPYMFLYETESFSLIGASPEVHVRLTDGLAEARPIAGTRPRGETLDEDFANERDLLNDAKERAEHLMLVDLARNDLGRVCRYGSVTVPEFMAIERYSHVMHIVSQVEGRLAPEKNAYDLMRATFPAGTVSGAPKVRAMQIISELEGQRRGPYAGALCYFSYDGNLDSCIAIRTALLRDEKLYIQSGAGLVADSQPQYEYDETVNKAKGMLRAVAMAEDIAGTPAPTEI
jgi:anthranilate synthase component 1